jgi:hypothetical protein
MLLVYCSNCSREFRDSLVELFSNTFRVSHYATNSFSRFQRISLALSEPQRLNPVHLNCSCEIRDHVVFSLALWINDASVFLEVSGGHTNLCSFACGRQRINPTQSFWLFIEFIRLLGRLRSLGSRGLN